MNAPAGTSAPADGLTDRLGLLREAFDRSFAQPPVDRVGDFDDLLAVRVGGRRYALRLAQTAGLYPDRPVTPLPGPLPALLGVAGFGGAAIPVYDLATMLGHPTVQASRWLVLARGTPALALAFADLDGHLRVPGGAIVSDADGQGCVRGMVPLPDGAWPLVDLPAVRAAVHRMTQHASEER